MNFRTLAQISLLFLLFMPVQVNGDPEDFREEAKRAIPCRPTTFEELYKPFEAILDLQVKVKFKKNFEIMFRADFPPIPKTHTDTMIANGFRCLYRKMADAHQNSSMEKKAQLQLAALHTTLAFHKVKITEFNQTLGEEITGFPCENCKESAAKVELEIESDGEGY